MSFSERAKFETASLRAGSIASLGPLPAQGMAKGRRSDIPCPPHLGDGARIARGVKRLYERAVGVAL